MTQVETKPTLFGTDGVRGVFGEPPLDRATVTALARALAATLHEAKGAGAPRVVLGGDTRESTPTLCGWLAATLEAAGVELHYCGMVPTPAVARLVRAMGADAGIAVSASHNPHQDNGIKLIDRRGYKWSEAAEAALEARMADQGPAAALLEAPAPEPTVAPAMARQYIDALLRTLPGSRPLDGVRIALDTANGAASPFAGELFTALGAEVDILHGAPDGRNINRQCGSTAPGDLAAVMGQRRHHLGFAFDGDADRAILVDEEGTVQDGDAMLYLWITDLVRQRRGPRRVVATVMSNLGLEQALVRRRIELIRCPVGDRQVVAALRRSGTHLGGEQSGHIIHTELSTTGDGMLTALQLAAIVAGVERGTRELLADFHRFPQRLVNVQVSRREPFDSIPALAEAVRSVEAHLSGKGRLLLRYSGTEPLARIMIEAPDAREVRELTDYLADEIERHLA
jgi:phosphoglucosamine mutase